MNIALIVADVINLEVTPQYRVSNAIKARHGLLGAVPSNS